MYISWQKEKNDPFVYPKIYFFKMSCGANPDYTNVCSDSLYDLHTIHGFCTYNGLGCSNISDEWVSHSTGKCECDKNQTSLTCQRNYFQGDPTKCCELNLEQHPTDS